MRYEKHSIKAMSAAFNMTKQRCYNENCRDYIHYGGRGIKVCDEWLESFDNFVRDMGLRPNGMTLERRDVNGDYTKDNCYWATRKQQSLNRRLTLKLTFEGETRTIADWSELKGIPYSTLKARVTRLGYTPEQALTKPVKSGQMLPGVAPSPRRPVDRSRLRRGLEHSNTRLSKQQVLRMRDLHSSGLSYSALAREYGVSVETSSNAIQGLKAYKGIK